MTTQGTRGMGPDLQRYMFWNFLQMWLWKNILALPGVWHSEEIETRQEANLLNEVSTQFRRQHWRQRVDRKKLTKVNWAKEGF